MKKGSEYYFYQNDHLGTPQKLVGVNGAVVWSAQYTAFGNADVQVETVTNNLRFPGQFYDNETGLHYNWFRYYHPKIGRYLRKDPIGFLGGDVNWYAYVWNNPINRADFLGLEPYTPKTKTKLEEIAPLVKQNIESIGASQLPPIIQAVLQPCSELYQAIALKFIADEYDERKRWRGFKGLIDEYYQDWRARHGLILFPPGSQRWVGWAEDIEHWKRGNILQEFILKSVNIKYHDFGPANIELKTALELIDVEFEAASTAFINAVMKFLTTDEGTALVALYLATDAVSDLQGHFCSCQYDRNAVEIMTQRIREGKDYWSRAGQAPGRNLTPEQIEQWKKNPNSFPNVPSLDPGELDTDKFKFIEGLIGITAK